MRYIRRIVLALMISSPAYGEPPQLKATLSSNSRILRVAIQNTHASSSCTYELFGAPSGGATDLTIENSSSLSSSSIASSVELIAKNLKLLGRSTPKSKRTYRLASLQARVRCGEETTLSNKVSLKIKISSLPETRSLRRWVSSLSDRFYVGGLALTRAYSPLKIDAPTNVVAIQGTPTLLATTQTGKIYSVDSSTGEKKTFLDLTRKVFAGGERGLVGLTLDPLYSENGYLYVHYTIKRSNTSIISRFSTSREDPSVADPKSEKIIIKIPRLDGSHIGGELAFGPDGYLYAGIGDGGYYNNSQSLKNLLGKIIRITVGEFEGYQVPPTNPFLNTMGARPEIYAYGLRNPWRFSFDPLSGRLLAGDVGEGRREEINVVNPGGNYGWSTMEGDLCFKPSQRCKKTGLTLPLYSYVHGDDTSIITGTVYRGNAIPRLQGYFIFGDFQSGRLWALDESGAKPRAIELFKSGHFISSFGVDHDGEILVVSYGDGRVYRLVDESTHN